MRRAVAVASVAVAVASVPAPARPTDHASFRLYDERITESSGLVASRRSPGLLWTHDDSGAGPVLYAVDLDGETRATVTLADVDARDWEDIAASIAPDGSALLHVGDIGDNRGAHPSIVVHTLPEPALTAAPEGEELTVAPTTRSFRYPGEPQDAETLLTDPATGRLLIVAKDLSGDSAVYATAPLTDLAPGSHSVLEQVATVRFDIPADGRQTAGPVGLLGYYLATGGDVSPTSDRVAIRTYGEVTEWPVEDGDVIGALHGEPSRTLLPDAPQGEAIAYTLDGETLVASSEGRNPRVDLLPAATFPSPAPPVSPPTASRSPSGGSSATAPDAPVGSGRAIGTVALAALAIVAIGALVARRR